ADKTATVKIKTVQEDENPYSPLTVDAMQAIAQKYWTSDQSWKVLDSVITTDQLYKIIDSVIAAPSAGNNQPWKLWYEKGLLFLYHDKHRSHSWGDYAEMGAHMSLGASLENLHLQSLALNLRDEVAVLPHADE